MRLQRDSTKRWAAKQRFSRPRVILRGNRYNDGRNAKDRGGRHAVARSLSSAVKRGAALGGFHSKWANVLVDALNETLLPSGYFAEPHVHRGARVEIDAATFEGESASHLPARNGATAVLPATWAPPEPNMVMASAFPDTFEVRVIDAEAGPRLAAVIELVSPANKDRPEHRRAFAVKCASFLCQGISLIVVDVVTSRAANLHDEIVRLLSNDGAFLFPAGPSLYAAAYRRSCATRRSRRKFGLRRWSSASRCPCCPWRSRPNSACPLTSKRPIQTPAGNCG